jgi:hypothetical protein
MVSFPRTENIRRNKTRFGEEDHIMENLRFLRDTGVGISDG